MSTYDHSFSVDITQGNFTIQGVVFTTYANLQITNETVLVNWPALWEQSIDGDVIRPASELSGQYRFLFPLSLENYQQVEVDIQCPELNVHIGDLEYAARDFLNNIRGYTNRMTAELRPYWRDVSNLQQVGETADDSSGGLPGWLLFVVFCLIIWWASTRQNQANFPQINFGDFGRGPSNNIFSQP